MDLGFVKEESQSGREIHFEKITPYRRKIDFPDKAAPGKKAGSRFFNLREAGSLGSSARR
jgi:hypothetical protein